VIFKQSARCVFRLRLL